MNSEINTYEAARKFLQSRIQFGMKSGLHNISELCKRAGHPERCFTNIHIVGTNGKGSTAWYLAQMLYATGSSTGLFTSPHLISLRERIRVNNQLIPESACIRLVQEIKRISEGLEPTFFETITLLALLWFRESNITYAVLEAGLGGRLDSTAVGRGPLTLLSGISLEHTEILGATRELILREKAGIVPEGAHLISALKDISLNQLCRDLLIERNATFSLVPEYETSNLNTFRFLTDASPTDWQAVPNLGLHFISNAALACEGYNHIRQRQGESQIFPVAIAQAWAGRMQFLKSESGQPIILDGAHNHEAVEFLVQTLRSVYPHVKFRIVFGMNQDKDFAYSLRCLNSIALEFWFTRSHHPSARNPEDFLKETSVPATLKSLSQIYESKDVFNAPLLICGSLHLIGEHMKLLSNSFAEISEFSLLDADMNEFR
jgi:dihydrofolate synthase/folylpolyglutamate synthase